MNDDILKHLSDKVHIEITIMKDDMALGSAKDFGAYQYACGIIRGLMIMNNIIIETSERIGADDD